MFTLLAGLALAAGAPADSDAILDLTTPEAVAAALQQAGYKAELKKDDTGGYYIMSAANGSGLELDLFCKEGKCTSAQIQSFYKPKPEYTAALANEWNNTKRFLKVSVNKDGQLREWFDFSLVGKMSQKNFADTIDWYVTMDGSLAKFLDEHAAPKPAGK
jgi:hypothetical protein